MTTLLFIARFSLAIAGAAESFRALDFDAALAAAKQEKKIVLISFQPGADAESQKLDQRTWNEPKVRKWLEEKSVALKLEPASAPDLVARFRVHAHPTIVLVKADGSEIDRIVGWVDPKLFREEVDAILGGSDALERLRKLVAQHANEPAFKLDLARMLFERGLFEESAREYLWCFDRGAQLDPTFADERNGPVLEEIVKVGRVLPSVLDDLAKRADAIAAKVADCSALRSELDDFARIAKATEHADRVLEVYDAVAGTDCASLVRAELLPQAIGPLVDAQRYDEVLEWIGDAKAKLAQRIAEFEAQASKTERDKTSLDRMARRRTVIRVEALLHHQALAGAKKTKEAADLADALIHFDRGAQTYLGLVRAAELAQDKPLAASIAERALADAQLAASDKKIVHDKTLALVKRYGKTKDGAAAPAGSSPANAKAGAKQPPIDNVPN